MTSEEIEGYFGIKNIKGSRFDPKTKKIGLLTTSEDQGDVILEFDAEELFVAIPQLISALAQMGRDETPILSSKSANIRYTSDKKTVLLEIETAAGGLLPISIGPNGAAIIHEALSEFLGKASKQRPRKH